MGIFMFSKVAVVAVDKIEYPPKESLYRPSKKYREYLWGDDLSEGPNYIYDAVRDSFRILGLDKEHYDTSDWNPLGEYINPGNTVLLKPNMVMHSNLSGKGNDCLYTHPSVLAAVLDYVIIALDGNGKIIIGDAPMQECNWDELIRSSGYELLNNWYRKKGIDIQLVDFRELYSVIDHGIYIQTTNKDVPGVKVQLGSNSEFNNLPYSIQKRMRITNYDPNELIKHHHDSVHEYYISQFLLDADVVIDLPKPKCHRKAGFTGALKNFIGVNIRKEYLPHHIQGDVFAGGDEYLKKSTVHELQSKLVDSRNLFMSEGRRRCVEISNFIVRGLGLFLNKENYSEGSWWGNNTISKTIADINKIVLYASKTGQLKKEPQRKIICIADMVISGEKEGPILPDPKMTGVIVVGDNNVCVDEVICTLMGFDMNKIPTLQCIRDINDYLICHRDTIPYVVSNKREFNEKEINEIDKKELFYFVPSKGWKGHIEI